MFLIEETTQHPGPNVLIDCPACGGFAVKAATFDQHTRDVYADLITVHVSRRTFVVCSECGARISSAVEASELNGKTPREIADLIRLRPSFVAGSLAVLALMVALFPGLGTVMAVIAILANFRARTWARSVSYFALILSLLVPVVLAVLYAFEAAGMPLV